MMYEIETIQKFLMEKTKKNNIQELNLNECKGIHRVPIGNKYFDVVIDEYGGIKIIGETSPNIIAQEFLRRKGILSEECTKWIIKFPNTKEIDIAELLVEFANSKPL